MGLLGSRWHDAEGRHVVNLDGLINNRRYLDDYLQPARVHDYFEDRGIEWFSDYASLANLLESRPESLTRATLRPAVSVDAAVRELLTLMAEGLSNAGIGRRLWVTEGTVEQHVRAILTKLDLAETGDDHRRVRAVIMFLESR